MKIAVLALVALLMQLLLFLCAGSAIMKMRKKSAYRLSGALLLGYFVYFSVFEVICFLCEIFLAPLDRLAVIMLVVAAAVIFAGTIFCGKDWILRLKTLKERAKEHGLILIFVIAAVVFVCLFALIYTDASADSDYYVGMASTALYTNTIGRFDPTSGSLLKAIKPRYAYALYPYHNAVIADLFRIPAIVAARTVMSVINALMSCIAVYQLGRTLLDRKKKADIFTILVIVFNAFSATIYLPGTFLFSRTFEGKNLIANLVMPAAMLIAVKIYRKAEENRRELFISMFFVTAAAVSFSASVVIPTAFLVAAILPYSLIHKDIKALGGLMFGILPPLVWAVLYVLNAHYVFIIRTFR